MKINFMGKLPEGGDYYEAQELNERELQFFESLGFEEIWYWYATAPYEGSGDLIGLKDGKYYLKDLGHCSCYGPTGTGISCDYDWSPTHGLDSLDDLLANVSSDYELKSIGRLVAFAKEGAR